MEPAELPSPKAIVARMMERDAFSRALGMKVESVAPGRCVLSLTVREDMCNGFGIAHGGISYSLADSALAFAANAKGRVAVSAKTGIAHFTPVSAGERIRAEAREVHAGKKLAHYRIDIKNEKGEAVAEFDGTVYLTSKNWQL